MPLSIFSGIAHGRNDLIETAVAAAATRETLAGQRKPNQSYTHITVWDLQKQILIDKVVFLLTLTGTVIPRAAKNLEFGLRQSLGIRRS